MKPQVRNPGSYEIVFYDKNNRRIREVVCSEGLFLARVEASAAKAKCTNIHSYTISKIIDNSLYDTWSKR